MRLLNVHLLKIGAAKIKSKVIKSWHLKIIFWGNKPLSWAPNNPSIIFFLYIFFHLHLLLDFRQPVADNKLRVLAINHSESSTNQLSLQLWEVLELKMKKKKKKPEEDAPAVCKWWLTKHGFAKDQSIKHPVQFHQVDT